MRSKLLRAIFPDRDANNTNRQTYLGASNTNVAAGNPAAQAFSQLLPAVAAANSASGLGQLTGLGSAAGNGNTDILETTSKNLDRLRQVTENQIAETQANTAALTTNTTAKSISQAVSSVSTATGGLLSGLTSLPIISGLLQLFGGGSNSKTTQPSLPKYSAPPTAYFDTSTKSGSSDEETQNVSYDRFGNPRITQLSPSPSVPDYSSLLATARNSVGEGQNTVSNTTSTGGANLNGQISNSPASRGAQVTVNIQAMDSRSFLDRSQDIAQAVREAMLNMHSINDVVNDL